MITLKERSILEYAHQSGKRPFQVWLNGLKDIKGRACIRKEINKLRLGLLSNTQPLRNGLFEIRIFFGPGYRVYFGKDDRNTIILLWGGDKGSQKRDIIKAEKYWNIYQKGKQ